MFLDENPWQKSRGIYPRVYERNRQSCSEICADTRRVISIENSIPLRLPTFSPRFYAACSRFPASFIKRNPRSEPTFKTQGTGPSEIAGESAGKSKVAVGNSNDRSARRWIESGKFRRRGLLAKSSAKEDKEVETESQGFARETHRFLPRSRIRETNAIDHGFRPISMHRHRRKKRTGLYEKIFLCFFLSLFSISLSLCSVGFSFYFRPNFRDRMKRDKREEVTKKTN